MTTPTLPRQLSDVRFDEDGQPVCSNPEGHEWSYTGSSYGGDDDSYMGEGRCYCMWCGADGDG